MYEIAKFSILDRKMEFAVFDRKKLTNSFTFSGFTKMF